jgi:hypothetical protein
MGVVGPGAGLDTSEKINLYQVEIELRNFDCPFLILVIPPTVLYLDLNLLTVLSLTALNIRSAQPAARAQHAARDTALFCLHRHLK